MVSLGKFGKVVQKQEQAEDAVPEYDTFEWCDETIRLKTWISPVPMLRLSVLMDDGRKRLVPSLAAISSVLEASILDEDYDRFEELTEENEIDIDVLNEVAEHLFILWCRRPTRRQSDSSTGLPDETTEDESNENSSNVSLDSETPDSSNQ